MTLAALDKLVAIAAEAARMVDRVYRKPFEVSYKGPRDPVTQADREANDFICRRLAKEFPGVPVVAEESNPETYAGFRKASRVLFVDPLDGTREFVKRNGEFVVMIGMIEGDHAVAGVLHAPASGTAWAGLVGHGAFCVSRYGDRRAIHVSQTSELAAATVACARTRAVQLALGHVGARRLLVQGSAGLKAASVSIGDADAYVAPRFLGKPWDLCAAAALVVASGGMVSDLYGDPINYRVARFSSASGVVLSNGRVHTAVLERLAQLQG